MDLPLWTLPGANGSPEGERCCASSLPPRWTTSCSSAGSVSHSTGIGVSIKNLLRLAFNPNISPFRFLFSVTLLLSAGLALALAGRKRDALPWRWFAYFALASALSEGVELYSVGLQDGPLLRAARCGLLIIASFSLFEFGRLGTRGGSGRRAGQWLLIPFLVAIGLGSFAGVTGMDVAARYGLGLIGGLWAAVAMWRAARGASPPSRVLMAAALLTGAFAATTCLAVPPAGLFPASSLNQDTFRDFVGQPLPFFRCLAAISLTVMIRLHGRPLRGPQGEIPNTGTVGRAELAVVLALIGIVLGISPGALGDVDNFLNIEIGLAVAAGPIG